jgi:integrase
MVPAVKDALQAQLRCKQVGCPWVFHSPQGNPIDANNFANRVWYPLLRYLGFKKRPPYQMRHTAATLMLAAGENPEWVARILGHSTTEMLFRVYSRYVPNLTRNDGGAYAGLLTSKLDTARLSANPTLTPDISSLSAEQRSELLKQLNADNQQGKSP